MENFILTKINSTPGHLIKSDEERESYPYFLDEGDEEHLLFI
ncbi:hypothetical protein [Wenyingzhuangia sp. IMCC45574]